MVYIRGNHRDYDEWGVPGWAWDDLFPYFLKAEDNERGASEWHGVGGPLPVSEQRSRQPRSRRPSSRPASRPGLARNDDFNGAEQDGVGIYQVTQRDGMRASAAVAYLHPAMRAAEPDRDALHARQPRALRGHPRGRRRGDASSARPQELRAEREVILCGGAYNSPQLLMLSGVGPAEHLAMREVEVLLDQPAVGENLSDHACRLRRLDDARAGEPAAARWSRRRWRSSKPRRPGRSPPTSPRPAASPGSAPAPRRPTSSSTSLPLQIVDEGMRDPEAHGVWVSRLPAHAGEPRLGAARLQRPDRASRSSATTSTRPSADMAADDRGAAADAGDLRPAGAAALLRRAVHTSRTATPTRRCARTSPRTTFADLPPGRHLRDRLGRRRRAAGRGPRGRCASSTPR